MARSSVRTIPQIARLRFRAQTINRRWRPKLEIWFKDGVAAPNWINGKEWAWPRANGTVRANPTRTSTRRLRLEVEVKPRSNANRDMQRTIGDFLQVFGLQDVEVQRTWDFGFGIVGRHSEAGWNIGRAWVGLIFDLPKPDLFAFCLTYLRPAKKTQLFEG